MSAECPAWLRWRQSEGGKLEMSNNYYIIAQFM